jgi:membrane associated rhomboid family serine protease
LNEEENEDGDEEERANYFLQRFSSIRTRTGDTYSNSGYDGDLDEESLRYKPQPERSPTKKGTTSNSYNVDRRDTGTGDEFETSSTGTNDATIATATHSLMDDATVLESLRTTLYCSYDCVEGSLAGSTDRSIDGSEGGSEGETTSEAIQHDPTVASFFYFFEFAQAERLKKSHNRPYLIHGLFSNLSDIRSDLEWAQDAAHRRRARQPYVAWADFFAKERSFPWFTCLLLVVITAIMVWAFYENDWTMVPLKENPVMGPSKEVLLKMGALDGRIMIKEGKWWMLVTATFLHAGIGHLLMNASMLLVFGRTIERNHGWLHTATLFLSTSVCSFMVSALLQPNWIMVGASGGIFGLVGTCVGDIVLNSRFFFLVLEERAQKETLERQRKKIRREMKEERRNRRRRRAEEEGREAAAGTASTTARSDTSVSDLIARARDPVSIDCRRRWVQCWCYMSLVLDILLFFIFGLLPFVDNFAHLGGFLFGFLFSLSSLRLLSASSFDYRKKQKKTALGKWCDGLQIFALRCGGALSAMFLVFVVVFFLRRSDGTHSPCPKCRYASCMALPRPWKPSDPRNWWNCDGCDLVEGQYYWDVHGQQKIYTTVDIFCPFGTPVIGLDISEMGYTEAEQIEDELSDFCRSVCDES